MNTNYWLYKENENLLTSFIILLHEFEEVYNVEMRLWNW